MRKFGWRPDLPDYRDKPLSMKLLRGPLKDVDLRKTGLLGVPYDQGLTSSCTGNGIGKAIEYGLHKQGLDSFVPSRLFIYYEERVMENTVDQPDAGAMIRNGIKVVAKVGTPREEYWPFDESKVTVKPSLQAYEEGKKELVDKYERVPVNLRSISTVLQANIPIVFGMAIYESFMSDETAKSGQVKMPEPTEASLGGHCMLLVGSEKDHFIVMNSWGEGWGDKGFCYIPHAYLTNTNLAEDFWAIYTV